MSTNKKNLFPVEYIQGYAKSQKQYTPKTLWLTGLSGSGKSTLATKLNDYFIENAIPCFILDGDNFRTGLCSDLGFSFEDREENLRRVAEVAKLLMKAGLLVVTSFISPIEASRRRAKEIIGEENLYEVFVKADLQDCIDRDPKGLYKKALNGEIKNFTGVDSPFDEPTNADLVLDTSHRSTEECFQDLLNFLEEQNVFMKKLEEAA